MAAEPWDLNIPEFNPSDYLAPNPDDPAAQQERQRQARNGDGTFASAQAEQDEYGVDYGNQEQEEEQQQGQEQQEEDPNAQQQAQEQDGAQPVEVTLKNGTKVTLDDLETRYMEYDTRVQAYDADTKAINEVRDSYTKTAQELQVRNAKLVDYLEKLVPPEPDISLASTKPDQYAYQKALHDKAVEELRGVLEITDGMREQMSSAAKDRAEKASAEEDRKLASVMPELANPVKMGEFKKSFADTAKSLGFTEAELGGIQDHRVYRAIHYAALGMKAEAAQKAGIRNTRQPRQIRGRRGPQASGARNANAMKQLNKSGSLSDAMRVDFDF